MLDTTLYTAAEATRFAGLLLAPFMPGTADKIMSQLGLGPVLGGAWEREGDWGSVAFGSVAPAGPLFPRIEVSE